MMRRNLFLLIISLAFSQRFVYSQQVPQYTQWSAHQLVLNPAHAGIKECVDVHTLYRLQWVGFKDGPRSGFATITLPIFTKRKKYLSARHGFGVRLESDRIAQFSTTRLNAAYAAHFNFTRDTRLSLGIYGGVLQMGYDPSKATTLLPDPAITREVSLVAPDASFGAWWNGTNYYVGLAIQNLIPLKWNPLGISSRYRIHTSFNSGFRFAVNEHFTLLPGIIVRIPPKGPLSADLQVMADINNSLNFGCGYRNGDALLVFAGFKINQQFSIQYAFDLTLSALAGATKNTHEISLTFTTCKGDKTGTTKCALF